jgi:hypothetical protein
MTKFLESEIYYHARSLEILTMANKLINEADLDADVQDISDRINAVVSRPASPLVPLVRKLQPTGMDHSRHSRPRLMHHHFHQLESLECFLQLAMAPVQDSKGVS